MSNEKDSEKVWPSELDLRGKTVRLRSGKTVAIPTEAGRHVYEGHIAYVREHSPHWAYQNLATPDVKSEYDIEEVLEEAKPEPNLQRANELAVEYLTELLPQLPARLVNRLMRLVLEEEGEGEA